MLATVLIGSPNGIANHLFDDRPTATVEGDFLIGLERGRCFSLSHGYSIAECGRKASFKFVFFSVDSSLGKLMLTAIFIDHDDDADLR